MLAPDARIATGTTASGSSVITIAATSFPNGQRPYLYAVGWNPTTATSGLVKIVAAQGATTLLAVEDKKMNFPDFVPIGATGTDLVITATATGGGNTTAYAVWAPGP